MASVLDGASEHYHTALLIADRTGSCLQEAIQLGNIGWLATSRGNDMAARQLHAAGLRLARQGELAKVRARVLVHLTEQAVERGLLRRARRQADEALAAGSPIERSVEWVAAKRAGPTKGATTTG